MVFTEVPQATATDDDVFRAFADGYGLDSGSATAEALRGLPWKVDQVHHVLKSHGVPIALRSEECVVFDARPQIHGHCVNALMKHVGRAGVFVAAVFGDDEVHALDHHSFTELCSRLGVSS